MSSSNLKWKYRVLVVEDNDDHADLVLAMLKRSASGKITTVRVPNAMEGLEQLRKQEFDVLLLDLSLPDSDPYTTLENFTSKFPYLPIIVLTSLAEDRLMYQAFEQGAQDYLDKSALQGDSMVRAIRYAVERKQNLYKLERQNEELKRFAHTLAHEIKNPLQCVFSALHLIQETVQLNDAHGKLTDLAVQSSHHLRNLIDSLLEFAEANPEGGFTSEEVDMESVTREVIDFMPFVEGCADAKFTIEGELPSVSGSRVGLRQVLENLLTNAVRYRSEKPLEINVSSRKEDGHWHFTVKDNGKGIDPKYHDKIFEPLFRIPETKSTVAGTGIGLGFCRSVIERHGGKISVSSAPGEGSEFRFTLPAE